MIKLTKWQRISIGNNSVISRKAELDPGKNGRIEIGSNCHIHDYSILRCLGGGQIKIGDDVSVNPFCVLYGIGNLTIGSGVRIATHTAIIPANHNFQRLDRPIYKQGITKKGITIRDDVWIGANVSILDGVTIGQHTVIAAGSVVTKNIPNRVVGAGVPCRVLKTLK